MDAVLLVHGIGEATCILLVISVRLVRAVACFDKGFPMAQKNDAVICDTNEIRCDIASVESPLQALVTQQNNLVGFRKIYNAGSTGSGCAACRAEHADENGRAAGVKKS
jgi:hypothetical protein